MRVKEAKWRGGRGDREGWREESEKERGGLEEGGWWREEEGCLGAEEGLWKEEDRGEGRRERRG